MSATLPVPRGKRACVIGAGLGGLALAIRLQAAGFETVLVEARAEAGGCMTSLVRDGFTFDLGPGVILDPAGLSALWALTGHAIEDDCELLRVAPLFRLSWPDGTVFDLADDPATLAREVARLAPGDLAGFDEFEDYARALVAGDEDAAGRPQLQDIRALARALPDLARQQVWRGLHGQAAAHVKNEKLREALSFRALHKGGNPITASAIHARDHALARDRGTWCVRGGSRRLIAALVAQFERIGGQLRLHDPAVQIHTLGNQVSEVETQSGWRERFDAVVSDADLMHTYRELLGECPRGAERARSLSRRNWSNGVFAVHFALEGSWPGIPHHTMLLGQRYEQFFADVFEHGVLPADVVLTLHHPSVTDPSLAPEGKSVFAALLPVANRGKLPIDWEAMGPVLEKRVLDEVGRRLIPDLADRIVTKFHRTPRDHALDFNAWQGAAYSLSPDRLQSGWLRPHHRDGKLRNFYLVGAGTHPGAGIPGVLASARAAAATIEEDVK